MLASVDSRKPSLMSPSGEMHGAVVLNALILNDNESGKSPLAPLGMHPDKMYALGIQSLDRCTLGYPLDARRIQ
jgi:hypothetical protein